MSDKPPIEPLFSNILCVREEEDQYVGLIQLPDNKKEKPMGARVVAVGQDVTRLKPGMFVLVGRFAGAEVRFRHEDYVVLREQEVLGIVNEEPS